MAPEYVPGASYYDISKSKSLDRFNVDCRQISQNENISEWVRPGCWHVLTFHAIGDERDGWEPITADQFSANMAELADIAIPERLKSLPLPSFSQRRYSGSID